MKNAKVINIIGGPGSGKTTVASELFSKLKRLNIDVENVSEFAKELVWESNTAAFNDRLYMHAMQNHRLFQMKDKLDYIITDSPLLLTSIYNHFYFEMKQNESYNLMIDHVVEETWNLYDNVTYYIERDTTYNNVGRRENEEDAKKIDRNIIKYLEEHQISYKKIKVNQAADIIFSDLSLERKVR